MGANSNASRAGDGLARSTPRASRVPSTVAMVAEIVATITEFHAEFRILGLLASLPYHSIENPDQAVGMPARLNDSTMSTAIGI